MGYPERQRVENGIKNAKQSFLVRGLPVRELIGNRLYVRMVALAGQVVILYKRTFEESAGPDRNRWGPMAKTIRRSLSFSRRRGKKLGDTTILLAPRYVAYRQVERIAKRLEARMGIRLRIARTTAQGP